MATRDVFSEQELAQLRGFPEIGRSELIRYFTLTPADEAFVRKFRGQGNVLGAAVQLCTLPWLGFVPGETPGGPARPSLAPAAGRTRTRGPRRRAGQSSQRSQVSVIVASPCRVRSRLAVLVSVVIPADGRRSPLLPGTLFSDHATGHERHLMQERAQVPKVTAAHAVPAREVATVRSDEVRTIQKRLVVEYGITLDGVWLPLAMLRRLGTHGPWDPPFTEATAGQERVLLAHLLAERHNQAGLHRGLSLPNLLDAIPFQPTASFGKISGGQTTHVRPGRISGMTEGSHSGRQRAAR